MLERFKIFKKNGGFTVVELLVVIVLIGIFSTLLIVNFRSSATSQSALSREASLIMAEARKAEFLAVSSSRFKNEIPCGYGIHYVNSTSAIIYFGSASASSTCFSENRNYSGIVDKVYSKIGFTNEKMEFKSSFFDVFFEPPDPRVYINNSYFPTSPPLQISIGFKGLSCPSNCKTISIYPSGRVEAQ